MAQGVYLIENTISGDVYVGSTCTYQKRIRRHFHELRQGVHHSQYLQRAFAKYGESAFTARLVEEVKDKKDLLSTEQTWIETLKPAYNMNPLATNSLGMKVSEETKQRLLSYSLARTPEQRKTMLGKKHSEETKRKQSEAAKGRKHTPETLAKLAERKRGRTLSEETRKRMSETHKDRWEKTELTDEDRERMSEASRKGWQGKTEEQRQAFSEKASQSHIGVKRSEASRLKQSTTRIGMMQSEESKHRISEAQKARWQKRKQQAQDNQGTLDM